MRYLFLLLSLFCVSVFGQHTNYVDPRIGSEGLGRVFIGPSCPFGMVKPSPDCTSRNNSGWAPMPEQVNGFGQVHVSGTGGGCKYGNILIQPFTGPLVGTSHIDYRVKEDIRLGYYGTTYQKSGIQVEVTTAERASFYAFTFKEGDEANLLVDAGFYLGETNNPEGRESQQFVGSEIQVLNEHAVSGYSRIRGGWNNGKAYTVYFYVEADQPIQTYKTWKELTQVQVAQHQQAEGLGLSSASSQYDDGHKTGALVSFGSQRKVQVKVGISFVSERKARENALKEIPHWDFNRVYQDLLGKWEKTLDKIELSESTSEEYKRALEDAENVVEPEEEKNELEEKIQCSIMQTNSIAINELSSLSCSLTYDRSRIGVITGLKSNSLLMMSCSLPEFIPSIALLATLFAAL